MGNVIGKINMMEVVLLLAIVVMIITQLPDPIEDLERDRKEYCEMVELHNADPALGWPDYKGVYQEVCIDDLSNSAPK